MANRIVRLDNVAATKVPSLLKSAKFMGADGATPTAIENGQLVAIRGLVDGEREVHVAVTPEETDTVIGVVCTPEVIYDQRGIGDIDLANFKNEADEVIRVAVLQKADIYSYADATSASDKEDVKAGALTAKHLSTEVCGRYTYKVVEVQ